MQTPLQRLLRDIHDHMLDPGVDTRVKLWARARRGEIRSDVERLIRPNSYEDFLLAYIQREAAKYKAYLRDAPHDHPYEGTRERRICGCDDSECPLKMERLPRELQHAESVDHGCQTFRHSHDGHPLVLDDARAAYGDLVQGVESELQLVMVGLANDIVILEAGDDVHRVPAADLPETWHPGAGLPPSLDAEAATDADAERVSTAP